MKAKELREQSLDDLKKSLYETSKSLFQLRIKNATGQLKQHHLLQLTQRDVARINTIIKEKEGQNHE